MTDRAGPAERVRLPPCLVKDQTFMQPSLVFKLFNFQKILQICTERYETTNDWLFTEDRVIFVNLSSQSTRTRQAAGIWWRLLEVKQLIDDLNNFILSKMIYYSLFFMHLIFH